MVEIIAAIQKQQQESSRSVSENYAHRSMTPCIVGCARASYRIHNFARVALLKSSVSQLTGSMIVASMTSWKKLTTSLFTQPPTLTCKAELVFEMLITVFRFGFPFRESSLGYKNINSA